MQLNYDSFCVELTQEIVPYLAWKEGNPESKTAPLKILYTSFFKI